MDFIDKIQSGNKTYEARDARIPDGDAGKFLQMNQDGQCKWTTVTSDTVGAIPTEKLGAAGGTATLDENGRVPDSQIPQHYEADITALEGRATVNEANIQALGTRLSSAENSVVELVSDMTSANGEISTLKSRVLGNDEAIRQVPAAPQDYANKTYQLQIDSNGDYIWVERVKLYQHFLEISTANDTGTHIFLQIFVASGVPVTSADAIKGLLAGAGASGVNAHGYAKESGSVSGHSSVGKIKPNGDESFIPVVISSTGSMSNGAAVTYSSITIADAVFQVI